MKKKKGLILGPIPKISPKSDFLKKSVTRPGTIGTPVVPVPVFQNKEPGYSSSGSQFWPKPGEPDRVDTARAHNIQKVLKNQTTKMHKKCHLFFYIPIIPQFF
jgi:hypothetical protein